MANTASASIKMIIWLLSFILLIWFIIFIYSCMLNHACISKINPHWLYVWSFQCAAEFCLIVFWKFCIYIYQGYWLLYQDNTRLIKWVWECFSSFFFLWNWWKSVSICLIYLGALMWINIYLQLFILLMNWPLLHYIMTLFPLYNFWLKIYFYDKYRYSYSLLVSIWMEYCFYIPSL